MNKREIKICLQANTWEEYNILRGKYYGYKKCCIHYFTILDKIGVCVAIVSNILYGKIVDIDVDHVLCPRCRRKQKTKKIKYRYYPQLTFQSYNQYKNKIISLLI